MEQPQSLSHAKQLLRDLELRKDGKQEMIGEYKQVLNIVVDAISKLTADDDESDTSLTIPETVVSDNSSYLFCGGSVLTEKSDGWIEEQHEGEPLHWKRDLGREDERDDAAESDDDLSISSDVMPLYMTDEDAIDEIDFTRELMGYMEGFEAAEMPIGRIEEEDFEPYIPSRTDTTRSSRSSRSGAPSRPPLPRQQQPRRQQPPTAPPPRRQQSSSRQPQQRQSQSQQRSSHHGIRTTVHREVAPPKKHKGHRRQRSGGSVPMNPMDIYRKEDPPGSLRRRLSGHQSLPDAERRRKVISCCSCRKRIYEGDVCDCGKWEC